MKRLPVFPVGAALLALASTSAHAQDAPRYAVTFDAAAQQAAVRLCLTQAHAAVIFAADSGWAMRFVSAVKRDGGGDVVAADDGWRASGWHAGECLSYRADLRAIAQEHKPDVGWQMGEDFIAAPQLWLLRPDVQGAADAQLSVELPAGWAISAPWRELQRDGNSIHFQIPNTPPEWSAAVAFGRFSEDRIVLPGGLLRLTILSGADAEQRTKLRAWLDHVSKAVLSAYGRLPLPEVQVIGIPVGQLGGARRSSEAVHFGQSIRGQGNALELLLDPSQPASEFNDDWTAVHELSHLMHPYLGDRGAWLAEGLATYYQNVLRARAGLLTPAQAWDRLYQGFNRGARTPDDETLEQVAQNMHRSHAFQRVYWAGAAYWLTVDRDLRRAGNGAMNLETALSRFRDCCLPAYREWRPEDFVARLDALAETQVFATRYREFAAMRQFPDWQKVYSDLGIRAGGEHLAFDADAKDAKIRDAIMAPRDRTPPAIASGR
jgi:M61 glycyl aminopeptidase